METRLGRVTAHWDRPEPLKFSLPLILIPEIFTSANHLALARGYFASMGWEVYAFDLRPGLQRSPEAARGKTAAKPGFRDFAAMIAEAIAALGRDAIVAGHGIGGLLALDAAGHPRVRATVALAPMLPGFRSRLVINAANWPARLLGRSLKPPRGRTLSNLLADADPFQRAALAGALGSECARQALEVALGGVEISNHTEVPRLIVAGDSDPFAPPAVVRDFAEKIGATMRVVPGRGHWLIGGRALERTVAEVQRFLVRNLGSELLLLYSDELRVSVDKLDNDG